MLEEFGRGTTQLTYEIYKNDAGIWVGKCGYCNLGGYRGPTREDVTAHMVFHMAEHRESSELRPGYCRACSITGVKALRVIGGRPRCARCDSLNVQMSCEPEEERVESVDHRETSHSEGNPNVHHPSHYGGADNPYEAIKVIEAWGLGFHLGNAVKYISRAGKKERDKEVEDLQKASWYLKRRIEDLMSGKVREDQGEQK